MKILAKRGKPPANRELHVVAGVAIFPTHPGSWINSLRAGKTLRANAVFREEKRVKSSTRFSYFLSMFARMFDLAPNVGFRRSWYRWKACATLFLKVPSSQETELGLEKYGPANRGRQSVFVHRRTFFQRRFWLDRGKAWRSESCTSCMHVSSFQRTQARGSTRCESGRLCAQAW